MPLPKPILELVIKDQNLRIPCGDRIAQVPLATEYLWKNFPAEVAGSLASSGKASNMGALARIVDKGGKFLNYGIFYRGFNDPKKLYHSVVIEPGFWKKRMITNTLPYYLGLREERQSKYAMDWRKDCLERALDTFVLQGLKLNGRNILCLGQKDADALMACAPLYEFRQLP